MNYLKHYELLIARSKERKKLIGYSEKHHIIPRCLGGLDTQENIAILTAREHFVAHLLLMKMYPNNYKLVKAVFMMWCSSKNQDRSMNRMYEWTRQKFSNAQSICQRAEGNSQYGTMWISNIKNKVSKKVPKNNIIENGWVKGRNSWNILTKEKEKLKLKHDKELRKVSENNNYIIKQKETLKPMLDDYKKYGFKYTKSKYKIQSKVSAFSLKLKRYFPDQMK